MRTLSGLSAIVLLANGIVAVTVSACAGGAVAQIAAPASPPSKAASAASATDQPARRDSEILRTDILPGLKLSTMPAINGALAPIADCYASVVATSPGSLLDNDASVEIADRSAADRCGDMRSSASAEADAQLSQTSPELTKAERSGLIGQVRRQMCIFGTLDRYRRDGRAMVFQHYLERVGREGRAGRPVRMLSGC